MIEYALKMPTRAHIDAEVCLFARGNTLEMRDRMRQYRTPMATETQQVVKLGGKKRDTTRRTLETNNQNQYDSAEHRHPKSTATSRWLAHTKFRWREETYKGSLSVVQYSALSDINESGYCAIN